MPDLTTSLLQRFGANVPPPTTPPDDQTQALQDELVKRQQAQDPSWKQYARGAIDKGVGFLKGLTGVGDQGPAGPTATNLGQLVGAGIPFAAPLGKVFHGTPNNFEYFDPSRYNKGDILGSFTHFTENPDKAEDWLFRKGGHNPEATRIIPAKLEVNNALDLKGNADLEDLQKLYDAASDGVSHYKGMLAKHLKQKNGNLAQEAAMHLLEKDPGALERAGFDGVRYHDYDVGNSWAVPQPTQAKTPWGVPLGKSNIEYPTQLKWDDELSPSAKQILINTPDTMSAEDLAKELTPLPWETEAAKGYWKEKAGQAGQFNNYPGKGNQYPHKFKIVDHNGTVVASYPDEDTAFKAITDKQSGYYGMGIQGVPKLSPPDQLPQRAPSSLNDWMNFFHTGQVPR